MATSVILKFLKPQIDGSDALIVCSCDLDPKKWLFRRCCNTNIFLLYIFKVAKEGGEKWKSMTEEVSLIFYYIT